MAKYIKLVFILAVAICHTSADKFETAQGWYYYSPCVYGLELKENESTDIKSPYYPYGYGNYANCNWQITSPPDTTLTVTCGLFNVEYSQNCYKDYFYVSRNGDVTYSDIEYYCGSRNVPNLTSNGNKIILGFASDGYNYYNPGSTYKFKCNVAVVAKPKPCDCGIKKAASRIVGGKETGVNEWPWQCALYLPDEKDTKLFCGCSLLNEEWVLTASHCTKDVHDQKLQVILGDHDVKNSNDTSSSIMVDSDWFVMHENFVNHDDQWFENDVSLVHLAKSVKMNDAIRPVCLPYGLEDHDFNGQNGVIAGWGQTSSFGSFSKVLLAATIPILNPGQCRTYKYPPERITNSELCTYQEGTDTCQGDSGGPLNWQDPISGRYYAVGITSWGRGCALRNYPGVYTNVGKYLGWIEKNAGKGGGSIDTL